MGCLCGWVVEVSQRLGSAVNGPAPPLPVLYDVSPAEKLSLGWFDHEALFLFDLPSLTFELRSFHGTKYALGCGSWKIWCEVRDTFPVGWNASEVHGAVDAGKWLQECKAVCSGYYVNHSPKCCWEYQDIKMVGPTMLMPEIRQIIMVTWCLIWNSKIALNFWGHFPVPKSTRTCHLKWWDLEGPMIFCPSELPKSQPLIGQVPAFSSEGLWLLGQQKVTDHLLVPGTNFFSVWLSWFWVGHQPRSGLFKGITANYARFGPCARLLAYLLIYLVFGRWWNI